MIRRALDRVGYRIYVWVTDRRDRRDVARYGYPARRVRAGRKGGRSW
jgi:hypothetical protein